MVTDIWSWQQADTVETILPNGTRVRLFLVSCAQQEMGLYRALMSDTDAHIQEKYGKTAVKFLQERNEETIVQRMIEWTGFQERAYMLAALKKVEVNTSEDGEWVESDLPATWRQIGTFHASIPPAMYRVWRDKVVELNPNVFTIDNSDEAKKKEKANAPASKSS